MASNVTRSGGVLCENVDTLVLKSFSNKLKEVLPFQLFLRQLSLVNIVLIVMRSMLKCFNQAPFVPEMLAGISLGPTVLGRIKRFDQYMFPPVGFLTLNVYDILGFTFFMFILNVRSDLTIMKNASKLAFIIGLALVFIPLGFAQLTSFYLRNNIQMNKRLYDALPWVSFYQSLTSFQVISTHLADTKLLNSELGRLAVSSSVVSGFICWLFAVLAIVWRESVKVEDKYAIVFANICKVAMIIVILFMLRPILHWMVSRTPEGKPLKEEHFVAIVLMILALGLYGEAFGVHVLLGPVVLGLVVPDGPPMGSSVIESLTYTVGIFLVPCYFLNVGRRINFNNLDLDTFFVIVLLIGVIVAARLLAVIVPSLYFKIPVADALSLGFILNWQGWVDIIYIDRALYFKMIDTNAYSVMILTSIARSAIFVPLVRSLYDPSRRYVAYKRRTVQHSKHNIELRILACVHEEDDVPSIIRLLEYSVSSDKCPMEVYVLDLKELHGRDAPILIAHPPLKPPALVPTRIDRIMNAFHKLESDAYNIVKVLSFTSVVPYVTMHDDVCSLALDKEVVLIILPFTKSYGLNIRTVQKNVLEMAPCSVGILVSDESGIKPRSSISGNLSFKACVIFFGGPDDREALAFSIRFANHPTCNLDILMINSTIDKTEDLIEKKMDIHAIEDFKMQTFGNQRIHILEEGVEEATQTITILNSLKKEDYNMVVVGRRHDEESSALMGFEEWTEVEELGFVGDMLGSSDFTCKFSLLVVQQQASVVQEMVEPN